MMPHDATTKKHRGPFMTFLCVKDQKFALEQTFSTQFDLRQKASSTSGCVPHLTQLVTQGFIPHRLD
jgi:hypothetical protein